ncbi:MAG: DUF1489 family protein [Beijerinckiaceae bacterium]|nr:DUF1489 family protein [Beijerinckiaceae bacterium]
MTLHLLKLCVGAESIADLEARIAARLHLQDVAKLPREHVHTTRMVPKRSDELLDGGSLFWVIKGQLCARQRLVAIRPFTDAQGIGRCDLVLEPVVVPVLPRPFRAFQGWRYLDAESCPPDLDGDLAGAAAMPEHLRHALRELCLL